MTESGEETEGPWIEPGPIGRAIDATLRFLAVAVVGALPVFLLITAAGLGAGNQFEPLVPAPAIGAFFLLLGVITAGIALCVSLYSGYRKGKVLCVGTISVVGWTLVILQGAWIILPFLLLTKPFRSRPSPKEENR